ncbi:AAA family ATPase [Paraburkholderia aromaticivorans]|uniref:AAA family ATPase n=1 Tax=Paraburkholderia aromaticivorans TaxID=2026199 RepID=UPI001455F362|nr:AAA family ATPase [Paraburkholderia aromaticivorans]
MNVIRGEKLDLTKYLQVDDEHAVVPASSWCDEVIHMFHQPDGSPMLPTLGWPKAPGHLFSFRPSEVTVWAGPNGSGKSMLTSQVALNLCEQGEKVCVGSLEMKPFKTMGRMSRQASGSSEPSVQYIRDLHAWTDGRLWLYDQVGNVRPEKMVAVIRYAREKFGIGHFFIDNLTKVVAGEDDYNAQKNFVNTLTEVAHDTGVHIHLVAHVRKSGDEYARLGKNDIKGTGAITDLADNVFMVQRNKKREAVELGKLTVKDNQEYDRVMAEPDCFLSLEKQRHGDWEGVFSFCFDRMSQQYVEVRGNNPRMYQLDEVGFDVDNF